MKHIQKYITVPLLVFFLVILYAPVVFADEAYEQFSLGTGSLGMAPSDEKSPDPGIVTANYGFKISKDFMPYMGTGLAYTYQPDSKTGDITKIRTGVAAQLGFKYLLGTNSTLKLDYKYLSVSPDLSRGDSKAPPQLLGIGFDIKF
jgi:outer membrane protein W